ncbi:MAG: hypothetical protein M3550_00300, partial [Actinomycetota bacterium]|nr:hypothetical protein [Actinomycetota bacterium]
MLVVALAFGVVAHRSIGATARDRLSDGLEANARLAVELLGPAPYDASQQAETQRRVGAVGRATGMRVTLIARD